MKSSYLVKYLTYKLKYRQLKIKSGHSQCGGKTKNVIDEAFTDFGTFVEPSGKRFGNPKSFPKKIQFKNLLEPDHDYFQIYVKCDLENANQVIIPNRPFYITNDESDGLFYKVEPTQAMSRIDLACEILNWLLIRNAYYNTLESKKRKADIKNTGIGDYASNLSIHGLDLTSVKRKGLPVYHINLSS